MTYLFKRTFRVTHTIQVIKSRATLVLVSTFFTIITQLSFGQSEALENSSSPVCFQTGTISAGLGIPYHVSHESIGINVRGLYNLRSKIRVGADIYLFSRKGWNSQEVNFVSHYIINIRSKAKQPFPIALYPIAGVKLLKERHASVKEQFVDGVLGIGIQRNVKQVTLFSELTNTVTTPKPPIFNLGLIYNFY
jgi:hypothetical protein